MESQEDGLLEAFTKNQDSLLFFIFFFTGFAFLVIARIAATKIAGADWGIDAEWVAFWLILLMTGYAYLIGGTRRFRITAEAAADNSYFLGFMFTISSLSVSLYRYADGTGGEIARTDQVIADLSIGLVTTLWGLLLRTWFSQLSWNPDGVQEKI